MLLQPDCIPCILKMSIVALRELALDDDTIKEIYNHILETPALRGVHWDVTSPEVIEEVMKTIQEATGKHDPFDSIKSRQNQRAMELYPFLQKLVDEDPEPLTMAMKLAILGNALDLMIADKGVDIEKTVTEKAHYSLPQGVWEDFKNRLEASRSLVYIGDNAGEIVFDKLFIETLQREYHTDVVFIVRGSPTLNDATVLEARSIGMDKVATVLENGIDGPLPGTILHRCSSKVRELMEKTDLIISKGGGNFDTLEEQQSDNITFMLLAKCYPYTQRFAVSLYHPVVANAFGCRSGRR